jgi:hypothetical protein
MEIFQMDEQEAIARAREYIEDKYPEYPTHALAASRFEIGWTIFPRKESTGISSVRVGMKVFLIGDSGEIMEASTSRPPHERVAKFMALHGNA